VRWGGIPIVRRSHPRCAASRQGVLRPVIIPPSAHPDIIPLGQPPVMTLLRIQSTMAWHQSFGYVSGGDAAVHARQVASILSGSDHIIIPVLRPLAICWFIQVVIESHHVDSDGPAGSVAAQAAQAWVILVTGTIAGTLEAAGVVALLSRDATARAAPTPPNATSRAVAGISHRRLVGVGGWAAAATSIMCT
jgi:hypothetical protein